MLGKTGKQTGNLETVDVTSKEPVNSLHQKLAIITQTTLHPNPRITYPVDRDHDAVPPGQGLGQVSTPPDEPGGPASSISTREGSNGLPASQVGHNSQGLELERLVGRDINRLAVHSQDLVLGLLSAGVQSVGEVSSHLVGSLSGSGKALVLNGSTVTENEDIVADDLLAVLISLVSAEVVIDLNLGATGSADKSGSLESLGDEGVRSETSAPHDQSNRDAALLLGNQSIRVNALNMVLSLDLDSLARKVLSGVTLEVLVEHGENLRGNIVDGDLSGLHELGVDLGEIILNQIMKLGGELDTGGTSAYNTSETTGDPSYVVISATYRR